MSKGKMDSIFDRSLIWTSIIMLLFVLWALSFLSINVYRIKEVERVLLSFNKHVHSHTHTYQNIIGTKETGGTNNENSEISYK